MPESTVEAVVQKAMASAPADKAEEQASSKAPTEQPGKDQEQGKGDGASSKEITSSDSTTRTAFELELIEELEADEQREFQELSETEQRSRLDWMKRRYRRDARQRTEDAKIRKAWGVLVEAGVQTKDLQELVLRVKGSSTPSEQAKAEAALKRGFARSMDQAKSAEEREAIQEARQTVLEEVEDLINQSPLAKRLQRLEESLQRQERQTTDQRRKSLNQEIDALEDKDGFKASLVETYRDEIRRLGAQYPEKSAWQLLHLVASEEELRNGKRPSNGAPEKKESARPASVAKKAAAEPPKTPNGRISLERVMGSILRKR